MSCRGAVLEFTPFPTTEQLHEGNFWDHFVAADGGRGDVRENPAHKPVWQSGDDLVLQVADLAVELGAPHRDPEVHGPGDGVTHWVAALRARAVGPGDPAPQ